MTEARFGPGLEYSFLLLSYMLISVDSTRLDWIFYFMLYPAKGTRCHLVNRPAQTCRMHTSFRPLSRDSSYSALHANSPMLSGGDSR
jgi:hypothetical protein